ncbi:MAG: hypothetical protein KBC30_03445 [Planctomycetes bacterium]|nr:hypothetical protein [Planctomycetota bacterium]HPY73920.1 hypothetical protein [Planctomycetota bacterium]HQA99543.1 hypothetical protein [Planctomycetota bacterium]
MLWGNKFALGNSIFLLVVVLIATFGAVTFFIVRFDVMGIDAYISVSVFLFLFSVVFVFLLSFLSVNIVRIFYFCVFCVFCVFYILIFHGFIFVRIFYFCVSRGLFFCVFCVFRGLFSAVCSGEEKNK